MSIDINLKNDIDTDFSEVSVAGELDVSTADEFKEYLHKLIDKGIRNIILDWNRFRIIILSLYFFIFSYQ